MESSIPPITVEHFTVLQLSALAVGPTDEISCAAPKRTKPSPNVLSALARGAREALCPTPLEQVHSCVDDNVQAKRNLLKCISDARPLGELTWNDDRVLRLVKTFETTTRVK